MGSPRKHGNTASLLAPFLEEFQKNHWTYDIKQLIFDLIWLYDLSLLPCVACRVCQKDRSVFGCWQNDDMQKIFDAIKDCDLLLLATPIYSWYCTPPMKSVLDRLVYGMNKYYGKALWAGKPVGLLTTCGYRPENGADLWEAGMKRYCKHSQFHYLGMLVERDLGYSHVFMDAQKAEHARQFARKLLDHFK